MQPLVISGAGLGGIMTWERFFPMFEKYSLKLFAFVLSSDIISPFFP